MEVWNSYRECWRFVHVLGTYHSPIDAVATYHPCPRMPAAFDTQLRVSSLALVPKYVLVWHTFDTAARNRV